MASIKLTGDTSGEITISAPAVAGTNTITLPASSGTMITSSNISSYTGSLTKDINIASGQTCTAGKALSVNSSGEVGTYPLINSIGSDQTGAAYTFVSKDGTRAIVATTTASDNASTTIQYTGYVISKSTGAVVGSTTQSVTYTGSTSSPIASYFFLYGLWSGDKNFVVVGKKYSRLSGSHAINIKAVALDIDTSGNVSKGTETVLYSSNTGNIAGDAPNYCYIGMITDNAYSMVTNEGNALAITVARSFTRTGSTFTTATDAEAITIVPNMDSNLEATAYTSNNIIVAPKETTLYTAAYTTNNIGTVTTTTGVISDNADTFIYWANINHEYAIAFYKDTTGATKLRSFSINQTTGAMTSLSTFTLHGSGTYRNFRFAYEDSNSLVFTYKDNVTGTRYINSVGLTSGTIDGLNSQITATTSTTDMPIRYTNTTKEYLWFHDSVNNSYTVQAYYNPNNFQFAGFVNSTTSTSPATVVVNGVASGFTGLTTGATYYSSVSYNGDITTSAASGTKVGVALSSTTLHIRY